MAFVIKRHDTKPIYAAQLLDQAGTVNEAPINLTNATSVKFIMNNASTGTNITNANCAITAAATGQVTYAWDSDDTATSGTYNVEFEIHWNDGTIETVPNQGYNTVIITDDLG
jgi:hypothetical protein